METPSTASELKPIAERTRWFSEEVYPYDGQLKAYLRVAFRAARDVEDVVQESYLRMWKAGAVQPIQNAKAFLFKVARRVALDVLRKQANSPLESGWDLAAARVLDTGPDAAAALVAQDLVHHLADAIAALPERWRAVIILHKIKALPQKEVAARLGLSERTVEKYCALGLERCEQFLRGRGLHGRLG